ncbi:hypothetical protein ACFOEE_06885 [Pseudoalteromonas fenneropenaei]|uniref:Signal peptide-containing protein n=1 Tax=Pseudoalteromonas fenneropenaei TaxID=1737459 RepID=A0ABV7CI68_9GAMM
MTLRRSLPLALVLIAGCQITKEPAPLLATPKKPLLAKQVYEVTYVTQKESARVKSVQLPAHPIAEADTVRIVANKVSLTDTLAQQIAVALQAKGLKVQDDEKSHYVLTIHQLDLDFAKDKSYQLQISGNKDRLAVLARLPQQQQCKSIVASVSMRLTHQKSSDVVWFAKASIDSASFQNQPLRYQLTKQQKVTNEQEVIQFVQDQNTDEARLMRTEQTVTIPKYKVVESVSELEKTSGACTETEVSALVPMMQKHLSDILIEKIAVK